MVKSYIFEAKLKYINEVIIDKSIDEFVRKITKAMIIVESMLILQ
jgi:flagellar biosynthesis regulator FlbT